MSDDGNAHLERITRENSLLLLIDHQAGWYVGLREPSPLVMKHNVLALARAVKTLGIPTVLTSAGARGPFGPFIHELAEVFPDQEIIDRTLIDAWQDARVRQAVARTGRTKLMIAGLALGVCGTLPALSAIADGYTAYVVIDASGDLDGYPFTEIARLSQAGAIPVNSGPLAMELLRDNADPKAAEVYAALGRSPGAFLFELRHRGAAEPAHSAEPSSAPMT
jgi:nicotinamidase-related amidase